MLALMGFHLGNHPPRTKGLSVPFAPDFLTPSFGQKLVHILSLFGFSG
jgi:hypothetical protein